MNCEICRREGRKTESIAMCEHCGIALCADHLAETQAYSLGGMTAYRCPHRLHAPMTEKGFVREYERKDESIRQAG